MKFCGGITKSLVAILILLLLLPSATHAGSVTDAKQLLAEGAGFTWDYARSRSIKIVVQRKDQSAGAVRASIGSGFVISSDGLFVTAYHVMKYCLANSQAEPGFSVALDCSRENPAVEYRAFSDGREYEVELVSYLRRDDSTKGEIQTPEDTIRLKDFVIGRLKAPAGTRFAFWELSDFKRALTDESGSKAALELKPLVPPKKVFIAGYPAGGEFTMADGFLNVTEDQRRGYFAWDRLIYDDPGILQAYGIPAGTTWGLRVANYMSGGPVIDASGKLVGLVVNNKGADAGILSAENVLETFFSRSAEPGAAPAVLLAPTRTPLYLKTLPKPLLLQ